MADPRDIVPYNDPHYYGLSTDDDVLNLMTDRNPTLADMENVAGPSSSSRPIYEAGGGIRNSSAPFENTRWGWRNNQPIAGGSSGAGPSNVGGGSGGGETSNPGPPQPENIRQQTPIGFVEMMQILVWPISPVPYLCSSCQVLREMVHINGVRFRKLEIHGRVGMISHAVFEDRPSLNPNSSRYQMFDFCNKNMGEIKLFLLQYNVNNALAEYLPVREPMSYFYDTVCVGMGLDGNANSNNNNNNHDEQPPPPSNKPPNPPPPRRRPPLPPPTGGGRGDRQRGRNRARNAPPRTLLADQRPRRRRKMTESHLGRKSGLRRRPRKLLSRHDIDAKMKARTEMERFHGEVTQICAGLS